MFTHWKLGLDYSSLATVNPMQETSTWARFQESEGPSITISAEEISSELLGSARFSSPLSKEEAHKEELPGSMMFTLSETGD